jgi:hypothetical protein
MNESRYIQLNEASPDGDRRIAIDPKIIHTIVEGRESTQIHTSQDGYRFVRNSYDNVLEKIDEHDARENLRS